MCKLLNDTDFLTLAATNIIMIKIDMVCVSQMHNELKHFGWQSCADDKLHMLKK